MSSRKRTKRGRGCEQGSEGKLRLQVTCRDERVLPCVCAWRVRGCAGVRVLPRAAGLARPERTGCLLFGCLWPRLRAPSTPSRLPLNPLWPFAAAACPPAPQDAHNADGTAASRRWRHGGRPAGLVHEPAHHHALLVHGLLRLDSAFSGGHGIANDSHAGLVRTCAPPAATLSPETPSTRNEQSSTGNQARCFAAGPGPAACPAGGACFVPHGLLCR